VRYYLGPWQFVTTQLGEQCWDAPAGAIAGIDLRSLPTIGSEGVSLFWTPDAVTLDSSYRLLGQGHISNVVPNGATRNAFASALGIGSLDGTTLLELLWDVLTLKADSTGMSAPKPLMPMMNGNLELHLSGHSAVMVKPFDLESPVGAKVLDVLRNDYREYRNAARDGKMSHPEQHRKVLDFWCEKYRTNNWEIFIPADLPKEGRLKHSTTISESFDKADGDILGPDLTWTELANDIDIISSKARSRTAAVSGRARADSDLSSSDNYVQAICRSVATLGSLPGMISRKDSSATETYYVGRLIAAVADDKHLLKLISGTATLLGVVTTHEDHSVDYTVRFICNGSTLSVNIDTVEEDSTTDTSVTSGLRTGLHGFQSGADLASWDDFEASDLAVAAAPTLRTIRSALRW
jgi:hypothetical protein